MTKRTKLKVGLSVKGGSNKEVYDWFNYIKNENSHIKKKSL